MPQTYLWLLLKFMIAECWWSATSAFCLMLTLGFCFSPVHHGVHADTPIPSLGLVPCMCAKGRCSVIWASFSGCWSSLCFTGGVCTSPEIPWWNAFKVAADLIIVLREQMCLWGMNFPFPFLPTSPQLLISDLISNFSPVFRVFLII